VSATTDDPVEGNNSSSVSTTVNGGTLVVTTSALPGASLGSAYSAALAAAGGVAPYSWSLQSGALPSGLSLTAAGVISGTPLVPGTSSFTVQVSDAEAPAMSATASLSITVGGCTSTVTDGGSGPLHIGAGVTCVIGASVPGPVSIGPGAVVVLVGATISGPLTADVDVSLFRPLRAHPTLRGQVAFAGLAPRMFDPTLPDAVLRGRIAVVGHQAAAGGFVGTVDLVTLCEGEQYEADQPGQRQDDQLVGQDPRGEPPLSAAADRDTDGCHGCLCLSYGARARPLRRTRGGVIVLPAPAFCPPPAD